VIYARDRGPRRFTVTVLALNGAENVVHRHRRRFDQAGPGVTTGTYSRCALENPSHMAGSTICGSMRALQWKAGRKMVKA
jgi:hypothetical protein